MLRQSFAAEECQWRSRNDFLTGIQGNSTQQMVPHRRLSRAPAFLFGSALIPSPRHRRAMNGERVRVRGKFKKEKLLSRSAVKGRCRASDAIARSQAAGSEQVAAPHPNPLPVRAIERDRERGFEQRKTARLAKAIFSQALTPALPHPPRAGKWRGLRALRRLGCRCRSSRLASRCAEFRRTVQRGVLRPNER
jgi:hypothetical protein